MPGNQDPDNQDPDNQGHDTTDDLDHDTTPPADKNLLALAGVLLLLPIVGLMWVSSYASVEPKLGGFPFFIWYQFLWVFLCSACTYSAYRLVLKARPHRPMNNDATNGTTNDATNGTTNDEESGR